MLLGTGSRVSIRCLPAFASGRRFASRLIIQNDRSPMWLVIGVALAAVFVAAVILERPRGA